MGNVVDELKLLKTMSFREALDHVTALIFASSPYRSLFFRCLNEFLTEEEEAQGEKPKRSSLRSSPLPLSHDNFPFFPFVMNDEFFSDDLKIRDAYIDELADWIKAGGDIKEFFRQIRLYHFHKTGYVIETILDLAKDLAGNISGIGQKTGIPLGSLRTILAVIVCPPRPEDFDAYKTITYITIPDSIAQTETTRFVLEVCRNIYGLLIESARLLTIIALTEFDGIFGLLVRLSRKNKGVCGKQTLVWDSDGPVIKEYLRNGTTHMQEELEIANIKSMEELLIYIANKYHYLMLFAPSFDAFIERSAKMEAKNLPYLERACLRLDDTGIATGIDIEKSVGRWDRYSINEDEDSQNQPEVSINEEPKEYPFDYEEEYAINPTGYLLGTDNAEHIVRGFSPDKAKQVRGNQDKALKDEIDQYSKLIVYGISKKIPKSFMTLYRLTGNPDTVISYLYTIIKNEKYSAIQEYYNEKLKQIGTSSRSLSRYRNEGKISRDEDLSIEKLKSIQKEKRFKKEHRRGGYFTQNQLIGFLTNKESIAKYKKQGITLPASKNTLKKRLKPLIEKGNILVEKEHGSYYFSASPENINSIAKALSIRTPKSAS